MLSKILIAFPLLLPIGSLAIEFQGKVYPFEPGPNMACTGMYSEQYTAASIPKAIFDKFQHPGPDGKPNNGLCYRPIFIHSPNDISINDTALIVDVSPNDYIGLSPNRFSDDVTPTAVAWNFTFH